MLDLSHLPLEVRNSWKLLRSKLAFVAGRCQSQIDQVESWLHKSEGWRPLTEDNKPETGKLFLLKDVKTGEVFQACEDWQNDGTWEQPSPDYLDMYNYTKDEPMDGFYPIQEGEWEWRYLTKKEQEYDDQRSGRLSDGIKE